MTTAYATAVKMVRTGEVGLDENLLRELGIEEGDQVTLKVDAEGVVTMVPLRHRTMGLERATELARRIIDKNDELFRRLS